MFQRIKEKSLKNPRCSERAYPMKQRELRKKSARDYLLTLLAGSDKSTGNCRGRLEAKGYPDTEIDAALAYAQEKHFLNDRQYAERFIRTKAKDGRFSVAEINNKLHKAGIEEKTIDAVVKESAYSELEAGRELLFKKFRSGYGNGDARLKAALFLQRKGFTADTIRELTGVSGEEGSE